MTTTEIAWGDGSGDKIYVTRDASEGNQTISVSSDANTGVARVKTVTFTAGTIVRTLTVSQEAALSNIPYIRNSGSSAYIDTGITPDNTTKVIVWARNFNAQCGILFGSQVAVSDTGFLVGTFTEHNTGRIRADYNNETFFANDQFSNLSGYHEYELYMGVLKVDGNVIASTGNTTFSNNYPIHIYGTNRGGNHVGCGIVDICAAKIYKGGVLVRDFVAVDSPSVGLYDSVSNTLFTNAGGGSFSYNTFNPNAYIPLEYISCTNSQYIDTGLYGTADLPVVVKFQIRGTDLGNNSILGTMRSGTNGTYFVLQTASATYKNRYMNFYIDGSAAKQLYNNNSTRLTNLSIIFVKDGSSARLVRNNATFGSVKTFTTSSGFSTSPDTILLTGLKNNQAPHAASLFNGYIYYAGFGSHKNFVPAKVGNVAGLYETYSDQFYPSASGTDFIAGPEL